MNAVYGYAVVFLGAGIGGTLRHAVNLSAAPFGKSFPVATLAINVLGGIAMGAVAGWFIDGGADQKLRLFLTTGMLGGFTTFSAFTLEAALLIERGKWGMAFLYAVTSVTLAIAGLFLGLALARN